MTSVSKEQAMKTGSLTPDSKGSNNMLYCSLISVCDFIYW